MINSAFQKYAVQLFILLAEILVTFFLKFMFKHLLALLQLSNLTAKYDAATKSIILSDKLTPTKVKRFTREEWIAFSLEVQNYADDSKNVDEALTNLSINIDEPVK